MHWNWRNLLGYFQLIRHLHRPQFVVNFVEEGVALTSGSSTVDLGDDKVFVTCQVRVPIDSPALCHQLTARAAVHLDDQGVPGKNSREFQLL